MEKRFALMGAILGMLAVALGAFGAHGLSARFAEFPRWGENYDTAAQYQMYHALALFAVAWGLGRQPNQRMLVWAGYLFLVGVVLFSGSLYVLSLTGITWLGMVTPFGGVAFIAAWILLGIGVTKS